MEEPVKYIRVSFLNDYTWPSDPGSDFLTSLSEFGLDPEVGYKENAAVDYLDVIKAVAPATAWAAGLATVIVAYLRQKTGRSITVKRGGTTVSAKGLTKEELADILQKATKVDVLETSPSAKALAKAEAKTKKVAAKTTRRPN